MSQIENVITTTFRARGGNVVSQLNSYASGFGRLGQVINENTNMSSRLNNQWRAIGTTIRYAIAGTAIFGLQRMVSDLAAVNTQLGQMQALTEIGPGQGFKDTQMGQLLTGLMGTAIDTISPLADVNEAAINFLSTVQGAKPSEIPKMLSDIGIAAKLSQSDFESMTQAATTMQHAFGRPVNPQTIRQFSAMFQHLTGVTPGGRVSGTTIAQAMPGLASMFQMAPGVNTRPNIAQAQLMALTQGVLMTGMPAASGMRGLTYLIQSLANPSPTSAKALAGIGITPEFVHQQGAFAAVMKLLHTVSPVSKIERNKLAAIPDDTLDQTNTLPGIPTAEMTKLRSFVPRIHGIRALIILASQLQQHGTVQSIAQDLIDYIKVQNENSRQAKEVAKAATDLRRRARMQEAAIALHTAGIQLATAFNPLFNVGSKGILGIAGAARHHPAATRHVAEITGGLLAALGVGRFLGVPGLRGFSAGQALVRTNAASALMSGATGLGASPATPLYVVVVGQLFGGTTSPPGGGPTPEPVPGRMGRFGRIARGIGRALPYAGYGAIVPIAALASQDSDHYEKAAASGGHNVVFDKTTGKYYIFGPRGKQEISRKEASRLGARGATNQLRVDELRRAQHFFPHATGLESFVRGQADVTLTIDLTDPNTGRRTREKVHVPVALWSGGRHPSHRGQAGKTIRTK